MLEVVLFLFVGVLRGRGPQDADTRGNPGAWVRECTSGWVGVVVRQRGEEEGNGRV